MSAPRTAFRFTNTSLAFTFTATLGDRGRRRPIERLVDVPSLEKWLHEAGLAEPGLGVSDHEFGDAIELREAMHRAGMAIASGTVPEAADVRTVNRLAKVRPSRPQLSAEGELLTWETASAREALSALAADAVLTFANPELRARIRLCENPKCMGLFLDASRGRTRRWCSMRTCGAAAKKRAYRARLHPETVS